MARKPGFDRQEAIRAARGVFWKRGYEDASLPELETATGLARSSIYNSFGSKRGLFDAAVESYLQEVIKPRLARLEGGALSATSLREYFQELGELLISNPPATAGAGCLMVNTAAAPIADDPAIAETISAYRAQLDDAMRRGVDARFPLRSEAGRDQLAQTCSALVIAALALARADTAAAAANITLALTLIED